MRQTVIFAIIALLLAGLSSLAYAAEKKKDNDREAPETAAFWTTERIHTMHFRITPQQWQTMQPVRNRGGMLERLSASQMPPPPRQLSTRPVLDPPATQPDEEAYAEGQRLDPNFYGLQFTYVKAQFECDGIPVRDVGFKQRGNSSFNWAARGYNRPFRVDFNRFVDGQKFMGLSAIHLNNNGFDPSRLRETLAYETFRKLGVPAPRTTFALVYLTIEGKLDREYLGLYTLIEEPDSKAFLKNNFGSAKGLLLKPWSIRGLPYLGEQWKAYDSRYNPGTDITPETARRTIDFIKLVNYADDAAFARDIENYLNVDKFLRLLAGQVILSNLDNFLYTGHNFYMYLHPKEDRFYLMPWDLNLAFANFTSAAPIEQALHLSLTHPHTGEMKLIDRLLAIPAYNKAYHELVRAFLADYFNPDRLLPRIDALEAVLRQADAMADAAWAARFNKGPTTQPAKVPPRPRPTLTGWQGGPAIPLKEYVIRRFANLKAQLAGETSGFSLRLRPPPSPPKGGLRAPATFGNLPLTVMATIRGIDGDYDQELSRAEVASAIRQSFAAVDSAKSGAINESQLAASLARALAQTPQFRGDRGRNRDRRAQPPFAAAAAQWAGAIFHAADARKNGRATLDQLLAAADGSFVNADKDKSNRLDDGELLLLLDAMAAALPPPPPPPPVTRPAARPATQPAR